MVNLKRILWHLLGGTRGGALRIRILLILRDRPSNTNQVTLATGADYKTIQHHLRVMSENRLVESRGPGYGSTFFLSPDMEAAWPEFQALCARVAPQPVNASSTSGMAHTPLQSEANPSPNTTQTK